MGLTRLSNIPDSKTLEKVYQGEVFQVSGFLQKLGYFDQIKKIIYSSVSKVAGVEAAARLREVGLEKMHLCLTPQQIFDANVDSAERLKKVSAKLAYVFGRHLMEFKEHFFIDDLPIIRFYVPHDVYSISKEIFNQRLGFLKIQGPHQDNWFGHSTGGINLWMAISDVDKGNGLLIYQDRWSENIEHDGSLRMPKSTRLGRPTNFQLSPGDLLCFHGEHLHSSEINITNRTRVVLTTRLCREKPNFKETSNVSPWLQSRDLPFKFRWVTQLKLMGGWLE